MAKRNDGATDESFTTPAWEWGSELAGSRELVARLSLVPTRRRGVWKITASAHEHVDGRITATRCKVSIEWPGATPRTLAATIMNLFMQLDHELGYDELLMHPQA